MSRRRRHRPAASVRPPHAVGATTTQRRRNRPATSTRPLRDVGATAPRRRRDPSTASARPPRVVAAQRSHFDADAGGAARFEPGAARDACLDLLGYRHGLRLRGLTWTARGDVGDLGPLDYALLAPDAAGPAPRHMECVTDLWDHVGTWRGIEDELA